MDRINQTTLNVVIDVDKEIRRRWILVSVVLEYFVSVVDLGDMVVVVLAPDILLEVVNVNVVVAELNSSLVNEDRVQAIRQKLIVGKLC